MSSDYYLKLKAAIYYYEDGLTQQAIANKMHLSRPTVSKLLKEAKEENIVTITINDPKAKREILDLEEKLVSTFHLTNAVVFKADSKDEEDLKVELGRTAAEYFDKVVESNLKIGLAGSFTLKYMIDHLKENKAIHNLQVVALVGGSQSFPRVASPNILVNELVNKYTGMDYPLYTPLLLNSVDARDIIRENGEVSPVLDKTQNLDVILLPIGSTVSQASNLFKAGYYTEEEILEMARAGVVGDLMARFIDAEGSVVDLEVNERVVGIALEDIKRTKEVVCVAGGEEKASAILGALKGGYIKTLISDWVTCQEILALTEKGC